MAWSYVPIADGDRQSILAFNECCDAIIERQAIVGGTNPTKLSEGDRCDKDNINALHTAIEAMIADTTGAHFVDHRSWATGMPHWTLPNILTEAHGVARTDWTRVPADHESGLVEGDLTAGTRTYIEQLNEIKSVLDLLLWVELYTTYTSTILSSLTHTDVADYDAAWAAAVADHPGAGTADAGNGHLFGVGNYAFGSYGAKLSEKQITWTFTKSGTATVNAWKFDFKGVDAQEAWAGTAGFYTAGSAHTVGTYATATVAGIVDVDPTYFGDGSTILYYATYSSEDDFKPTTPTPPDDQHQRGHVLAFSNSVVWVQPTWVYMT